MRDPRDLGQDDRSSTESLEIFRSDEMIEKIESYGQRGDHNCNWAFCNDVPSAIDRDAKIEILFERLFE